jgi:hypothetical protein
MLLSPKKAVAATYKNGVSKMGISASVLLLFWIFSC